MVTIVVGSPFATCTNSLNSYQCACSLEYSGDGLNCTAIVPPVPKHHRNKGAIIGGLAAVAGLYYYSSFIGASQDMKVYLVSELQVESKKGSLFLNPWGVATVYKTYKIT
eukprot:Phypoly_transcript_11581.p2 GENE.Phypoly_transcript_11581~~Phypoly_transcript_11581.p2  ORF type:complete len:110 (+),score=9.35 Phypoly_transcript_11581:816-1145(+)